MTRGALRFTEEQFRAHREKSDRIKVGADQRASRLHGGMDANRTGAAKGAAEMRTDLHLSAGGDPSSLTPQRPPDHSSRPLLPARGAPIRDDVFMLCHTHLITRPIEEHRFHPHRKWRFDYAWVREQIALEVEGGVWTQGRHTRGKGFLADMEKYNAAVLLGWRVLRTTPDKLADGVKSVRLLMLA